MKLKPIAHGIGVAVPPGRATMAIMAQTTLVAIDRGIGCPHPAAGPGETLP
jgi:hypothetical protein